MITIAIICTIIAHLNSFMREALYKWWHKIRFTLFTACSPLGSILSYALPWILSIYMRPFSFKILLKLQFRYFVTFRLVSIQMKERTITEYEKEEVFGMTPSELCNLVRFVRRTATTCSCESYLWQARVRFPKCPAWYLVVMRNGMLQEEVLLIEQIACSSGWKCGTSPGE